MTWSAWVYATADPGDDGDIVSKSRGIAGWQFKTTPIRERAPLEF